MNREKLRKIIKAFVFCGLLLCIVCFVDRILERKAAIVKTGAFFGESTDIDVLFLGDSHMADAVFPMELWNDYGITSHNCAGGHSTLALDYWILKNALEYSKPELVVLDCTLLSCDEKVLSRSIMHEQVDEFSLNKVKIDMLNDLFDNWNDKLEFVWNFSLYHSRWNELSETDFESKEALADKLNRGSVRQYKVAVPDVYDRLDRDIKVQEDTVGVLYLRKIIQECQKENIDILLVYLPFPASKDKQMEANAVYDIASEYKLNYVNFLNMDTVDYNTDCHDANSHLNVSGARKVTDFIGAYITENYNIVDHRNDESYASWKSDYEAYMDLKISDLKNQQEMDRYLMMLADKNLSLCLYIDKSAASLHNERIKSLIKNLSLYKDLEKLDSAFTDESSYFLIVDNGAQTVTEIVGEGGDDLPNTTFGHVRYEFKGGQFPSLYLQDGENDYLEGQCIAAAVVIDKNTGAIEDEARFETYDEQHCGIRIE